MEVKMENKNTEKKVNVDNTNKDTNGKKLTQEQVVEICNQLIKENQALKAKCNELMTISQYKRIDYLFAVINSTYPFNKVFRDTCANELEIALTPTDDTDTPQDNKETNTVKK